MGSEGERVFKNLAEIGLESPQAAKCGDLLTLMLTRCWPKQQGGIPCSSKAILEHVLTWRLWPCFLRRFGNKNMFLRIFHCNVLRSSVLVLRLKSVCVSV